MFLDQKIRAVKKKNVSSYTKRSFGITSFERKDRAIEPIIEILTGRFWESQTRVR